MTLNRLVQDAAQHAVDGQWRNPPCLPLRPSTGRSGCRQNDAADADGPAATTGLTRPAPPSRSSPPGRRSRTRWPPDNATAAPARIDIGDRTIPNYDKPDSASCRRGLGLRQPR